jgi:ERCC4-type nuclease
MENPKLVALANEFFEQARALEPSVKRVVISFEDDQVNEVNEKMMRQNPEILTNKMAACVYVSGIGVICF